ncbi:DUF4041 domain-containing protein [Ensifer adhaerens]|uniref:DUF4041 domain-containing protein n=1 Tax=Ensifer adhaerens TaxID=106592 RepID=UPI003D022058
MTGDQGLAVALAITFAVIIPVLFVTFLILFFKWRRRAKALGRELTDTTARLEAASADALRFGERASSYEARFSTVIDADAEAEKVRRTAAEIEASIAGLRSSYAEKKSIYDRLLREVAVFDDRLAFAEMGVYEPHFDFGDSEQYKQAITAVREEQKRHVTAKTAVVCTTSWTVDGSSAKGQTMTNRNIKLTLRAFNNECDAAVANVRWNNANAMERRILTAKERIDNLNASNSIFVTSDYLQLKLKELYLTHEYREKVKAEKEERAEAARLAKEEAKLIRDMEKAEEEEAHYQRLLDKARAEAAAIVGPKLDTFSEQIKMLERDLAAAHAKVERAQAMAEKTRSGYVYIISNIGSFGDDVVKIGLTRRLDPADRVRELGDASVPFIFDTHAVIYSDDAPALERALHAEFEATRVNAQNYRKEFFRVGIEDVEAAVKRLAPNAPFFRDVEAQDYRETLARRNAALLSGTMPDADALPLTI